MKYIYVKYIFIWSEVSMAIPPITCKLSKLERDKWSYLMIKILNHTHSQHICDCKKQRMSVSKVGEDFKKAQTSSNKINEFLGYHVLCVTWNTWYNAILYIWKLLRIYF